MLHLVSDHPNIAELKAAYEDGAAVHLVLEMCKGGELFDRQAPAAGWLLLSIGRGPLYISTDAPETCEISKMLQHPGCLPPSSHLQAQATKKASHCGCFPFTCRLSKGTCPARNAGHSACDKSSPACRPQDCGKRQLDREAGC